jgi:hypothetical protein
MSTTPLLGGTAARPEACTAARPEATDRPDPAAYLTPALDPRCLLIVLDRLSSACGLQPGTEATPS